MFVLLQLIAVKIIGKRCEAEAESESANLDLLTETEMNELSLTSSLVKAFGLSKCFQIGENSADESCIFCNVLEFIVISQPFHKQQHHPTITMINPLPVSL